MGLRILAEQGFTGLKLTTVCAELDVTTGGFYYYFKNLRHFIDELINYWLESWTEDMVRTAEAESDPFARLRILIDEGTRLPHQTEAAIRHWAASDPAVATAMHRADSARTQVLRDTLATLGLDEAERDQIAESALYLLIGYEFRDPQRQNPETFRWGLHLLLEYIERRAAATSGDAEPEASRM
ncbi:TetR/AcrR family transcriptional regulator [Nocardioides marmoriginsengisoli]|uniref:TetR/AcrR family transcriptional regulator n=1 Tax=Nocardioides marmoriginsengisoli TaxID=661483 RepID=UPI00160AF0F1|nr:TetR/AcrR family transcriptional regulator [Nocardioides marmoriginsengisoli]